MGRQEVTRLLARNVLGTQGVNVSQTDQVPPSTPELHEIVVAVILGALKNDHGIHAETAIATAAALTGECVLRASGIELGQYEPGAIITSNTVNQILFEADGQLTVSDFFMHALFSQGIDVREESWPKSIPDEHQVMMDPLEVIATIRPQIEKLFMQNRIERLERAYLGAQATAYLVSQTRRVIDPNIGKALALEAMLRGAKYVPVPSIGEPASSN